MLDIIFMEDEGSKSFEEKKHVIYFTRKTKVIVPFWISAASGLALNLAFMAASLAFANR